MAGSPRPLPVEIGRTATRAFEEAGYHTLDDVEGASERALLALHGVGPRAIKVLSDHGVTLAH